MNALVRRLAGVLLTLVLLVLPATAAHGEPLSGTFDRWTTSVADLFGDLLDGLLSFGSASTTDDDTDTDPATTEPTPTAAPTDSDSELTTTSDVAPSWDPAGAA